MRPVVSSAAVPRTPTVRPPVAEAPRLTVLAKALDGILEASIVGSFSRLGWLIRRRTQPWPEPPRLDGRVIVVTGASSGIGRAVALALGELGAEVWAVGRDEARTAAVCEDIRSSGGRAKEALLDVGDRSAIAAFAQSFSSGHHRLDGLVHGAGALSADYTLSPEGIEQTVATHVLGPFWLTKHLAPLLSRSDRGMIVTISSGGMYTQRFDVDRLEMEPGCYDGIQAYARAKRAQVVLTHEWTRRWSASGVIGSVMHPGWVDTPGLATGLPSFSRLGPLLRRPEEGADTAVWLASGAARESDDADRPEVVTSERGIWHDRRRRGEYYLPWTRPHAEPETLGRQLWDWCTHRLGGGDA